MFKINWRGDNCHNFYPNRHGYKPVGICNHITAGTRESVYYWFTSPNNKNASSAFVVGRDGSIDQYVRIEDGAWTQGIPIPEGIPYATAPIVKEMGINPNYYLVGIEHEGYVEGHEENGETVVINYGLDGDLTEIQFYASCWLHKFIQEEVERLYGVRIPLNTHNVVGHYQIDPRRKPNCPGPRYPWTRLYSELVIADRMTLEEYEGRITYLMSDEAKDKQAYEVVNQILYLYNIIQENQPSKDWAKQQLLLIHPILKEKGLI